MKPADAIKILVIHGPNLNLLGKRDPAKYGSLTLAEINQALRSLAEELGVGVEFFQSNHEGAIIDYVQTASARAAHGVLINPGALIRYAYCFRQALVDLGKPVMEVHMSEIGKTGVNQRINVLDDVRIGQVTGLKEHSYYAGLKQLAAYVRQARGEQTLKPRRPAGPPNSGGTVGSPAGDRRAPNAGEKPALRFPRHAGRTRNEALSR